MTERLQKILSQYGIASRREAERLILASRVCLNGVVVTELGTKADPDFDAISIDGKPIARDRKPTQVYLLLNKPTGVLCTRHDPQGRRTIQDLLPPHYQHLYSVGRLDYNSSGALLLTNDGDLANQLTHPKHHVPKTYEVWVQGYPSPEALQQWQRGIDLDGQLTLPAEVQAIQQINNCTELRVVLREGRNRQIRRVAEYLGYPVVELHRVAIATIEVGSLKSGKYRLLQRPEIQQIQASAQSVRH